MAVPESPLSQEIVGLIAAGGSATRIGPLPCSKEVYPVGFRQVAGELGLRPKVVCHYLLEKMKLAGITKAYIVLREGKWDIPTYFRDGTPVDLNLAYLVLDLPFGAPYTLDQAYAFVRNSVVAFGFPDMIFQPDDVFVQLLARRATSSASAILGLFPAEHPHRVDMVALENNGRVRQIVVKPRHTRLSYTWGIAVWTPEFTQFLHDYVATHKISAVTAPEMSVGDVIQAAIEAGLLVEAVPVSSDPYLDIGTPEDLVRAVRRCCPTT